MYVRYAAGYTTRTKAIPRAELPPVRSGKTYPKTSSAPSARSARLNSKPNNAHVCTAAHTLNLNARIRQGRAEQSARRAPLYCIISGHSKCLCRPFQLCGNPSPPPRTNHPHAAAFALRTTCALSRPDIVAPYYSDLSESTQAPSLYLYVSVVCALYSEKYCTTYMLPVTSPLP